MRFLPFCLLGLATLAAAAELPLGSDFAWETPPGHGRQEVGDDGVITVVLTLPPVDGAKDCWQNAGLKTTVRLENWKTIAFSARSSDGKTHMMAFYLSRRLAADDQASFYRRLEIGPEWRDFDLPLLRNANTGFHFAKGSKNGDMELDRGGELLSWSAAASANAALQFKNLRLTDGRAPLSPAAQAMADAVRNHPKFQPYAFAEVLKPAAVPVAGMVIDLPPDSGETEQFAAAELAAYLAKATGDEFPVRHAGPTDRALRLRVTPAEPAEAFASQCLDDTAVTITGNSPRALLYAVYDFLEKAAGVRFLMPLDDGEIVPRNPDLRLPLFRDQSSPLMSYRCSHYCSNKNTRYSARHLWDMADWAVKNRYNVELERIRDRTAIVPFYQRRGGCIWLMENAGHNFHQLIPPRQYFADHPEFFCFDRATGHWRHERAQLCTTNPDLIRELARLADEYFTRHPDQTYFPLFQEDGARLWCQCSACLALNPSGSNLASTSENNINLANQVCAEIRKTRPDRGVWTYAYQISCQPPVQVKPTPGVRIMYCYYSDGDPRRAPWESTCFEEITRWSQLTAGNVVIYSYHYLNPRYSFNDETTLVAMFRMFNLAGIGGSNQECSETWGGIDGYLMYLGARLAWNPWFDEEALKKDYFDNLYGAAGPDLQKAHDLLRNGLCNPKNQRRFGFSRYPALTPPELQRLQELLAAAAQAVLNDSRAARAVQTWQRFLGYVRDWSSALDAADRYYRAPTEPGYTQAKAAVATLHQTMDSLTADRILSLYVLRMSDHFNNSLDNSWRIEEARLRLEAEYDLLRNLTLWKFAPDPQAEGDTAGWQNPDFNDAMWKEIEAGKFWEDQGFPSLDGAGWYRCRLDLPADTRGLGVHFSGADERAWVYLDGVLIGGQHEGDPGVLWQQPFTVILPENTRPGPHLLAVKVIDSGGAGGLWNQVVLVRKK